MPITNKPSFPILQIFPNDTIIYGCGSEKDFYKCDIKHLGIFSGSIVLDCNGLFYKIERATKTGWGNLLLGYNPLMKGRLIKVRFEYNEIINLTLEDFKMMIKEQLGKKANSKWYPNKKSFILNKIEESTSFKPIIELFIYEKE